MQKGILEISRDFLSDFVGFERGVFYTIKKLLFDPYEVVEAYKEKDSRICTPFSLIVLVFSLFFFVSMKIGLDSRLFALADKLAAKAKIPEIASLAPLVWTNLPFLLSVYVVLACGFLSLFTRKLNLSFYDHLVANLYNLAVSMAPFTLLILTLPLINFNPNIFNLIMAAMFMLIIYMKKIKLRILFYYPEDARDRLKKYMILSGIMLAIVLLAPFFWLIISGRI